MDNENIEAKKRIMDTVVTMLKEEQDVSKMTVRKIAEEAGVNSALINYHFQSKEKLIFKAVEICMEEIAGEVFNKPAGHKNPVDRLKHMIKSIATFSFNNYYLSEMAISAEMKTGNLGTSQIMLPLLMEIYGSTITDTELKLMALQLVVPMQVLFLNASDYKRYLLVDLYNEEQRNKVLDKMVDNLINGGMKE